MRHHADLIAVFGFVSGLQGLHSIQNLLTDLHQPRGIQGDRQFAALDIIGISEEGRAAHFAAVIEDLSAGPRHIGMIAQRLHPRLNVASRRRLQITFGVLVRKQRIERVMAVEHWIDQGINRVSADDRFFQEALGAGHQQILRQDFAAFEQEP